MIKYTRNQVLTILKAIRDFTNAKRDGYLKDIEDKGDYALVTCPFHKNHNETKPACGVFLEKNGTFEVGSFHCFACNAAGSMLNLVGACLHLSEEASLKWVQKVLNVVFTEDSEELSEISLDTPKKVDYLNPKVLENYDYYHPYMWQRKLSKEVVDKFRVGYDKNRDAITFPVWDEKNNLVMLTSRSTKTKHFYIDKDKEKPVYLLNFAQSISSPFVVVCESQIDALYSWSMGYPAVAMIGLGSPHQYEVLNKCPIRNYVLMFDNDAAGRKASTTFQNKIRKDVFVTDVILPIGKKDINDLTKEEFENTLKKYQLF